MSINSRINKIIDDSIRSVLNEGFDYERSYDDKSRMIDEILDGIAKKNGWWYENDMAKYGRYIELGGSQVFFDVEDDGRIYISNIKTTGMSSAESSVNDCEELMRLLYIFTNNKFQV